MNDELRQFQVRDYRRIEQAIGFIRAHVKRQPSLAEVAAHVHLSEYHFQKLFKSWAGVTPKQFIKHLTLESAKQQLEEQRSTVETALEVGLSGSGRLHDLFVTMDAVTPGEFARKGEGLEIRYGVQPTKFGYLFIALTDRGLCQLTFIEDKKDVSGYELLKRSWPNARLVLDLEKTVAVAELLFREQNAYSQDLSDTCADCIRPDHKSTIRLLAKGTNFQVQVWKALLNLPYGSVTSYQQIADAIGRPKSVRAVASAIGANPLAYIIPCHRVLRGTGELGGYRWGLDRKSLMLGWEAEHLS